MRSRILVLLSFSLPLLSTGLLAQQPSEVSDFESDACTNVLVSKGASVDGSTFISYSADAPFMPKLIRHQGGEHLAGEPFDVVAWENDEARGPIRQVARTHSVVGLINEHQLALAETTTGGRRELRNPEGLLDYDALMWLTLQRATNAREAIEVIDALCAEYGYGSSGESFSISDPDEVWLFEILGRGPGQKGALWVAARVPDGCVTAHANMARIDTFPLDDPDNWRYSPDVIDFAVERGWYDRDDGVPFSWRDVYHPNPSPGKLRACAARVWSILRRAAPSLDLSPDYHRAVPGSEPYPLFVKPDRKLSLQDVMGLMRDHFEGTEFDLSKGIAAGPFGCPYRFRNLSFSFEGVDYMWERAISTQQAGFTMVAQCRGWLPDPIGGVYWYTPDDCYTSAFTPLYCGMTTLPEPYTIGDYSRFDWNSGWWITNLVSNLTYDRWVRILPDVQQAQREYEETVIATMQAVDSAAAQLMRTDAALARRFITDWSVASAERLFADWQELATQIITRHVDGYVQTPEGSKGVNYPDAWLRAVLQEQGDRIALPQQPTPGGNDD